MGNLVNALEQLRDDRKQEQQYVENKDESLSHKKVLRSLKSLRLLGYDILVEETGNRLDLPNELFQLERKGEAQRTRSLCYTDAIVHANRTPRILIEVVDKNPTSPSGITGLTVNVDRIAEIHPNIDLLFIVLAEMKNFYCSRCRAGHKLSNSKTLGCLNNILGANPDEDACLTLIHEGKAANFRKALIDYPIRKYLHNISPPTVLFLNFRKVRSDWEAYRDSALDWIEKSIVRIISTEEQAETHLINVRELLPPPIPYKREEGLLRDESSPPPPGSRVTWKSPKGGQTVVIKNRGSRNTRVWLADGQSEKVPNGQLVSEEP